jgi:hypothetical protein
MTSPNNNNNNNNEINHIQQDPSSSSFSASFRHRIAGNGKKKKIQQKHRIAIIIPFIGESPDAIPSYLELFCATAGGSASLVDFLLIHDGVLDPYHQQKSDITTTEQHSSTTDTTRTLFSCPENVIFHSLGSLEGISRALVEVVDGRPEQELKLGGSKEKLAGILTKYIRNYPYVMVEFKPALGHVFKHYLEGYTHWGYSDLDIMFGDLERWITPDELTEFDIVTYGFGDQHRVCKFVLCFVVSCRVVSSSVQILLIRTTIIIIQFESTIVKLIKKGKKSYFSYFRPKRPIYNPPKRPRKN